MKLRRGQGLGEERKRRRAVRGRVRGVAIGLWVVWLYCWSRWVAIVIREGNYLVEVFGKNVKGFTTMPIKSPFYK